MVLSLSALVEPVGSMKQWLPAITGVAGATVPQNWLICDGSTVSDAASPYNGIALPDSRAKFKRGHNSITNANFATNNVYKAGGTIPAGGSDTDGNGGHSHSYNVSAGDHSHDLSSHTHGPGTLSGPQPDHFHTSHGGTNTGSNEVYNGVNSAGLIGSVQNANNVSITSGSTAGPSNNNSGFAGAFNINGSVNPPGSWTSENRPAFLEFVTIIKVK